MRTFLVLLSAIVALALPFLLTFEQPAQFASIIKTTVKTKLERQSIEPKVEALNPELSESMLTEQALAMDSIDHDPAETLRRLQETANKLTDNERDMLTRTVTDPRVGENERMMAAHLLVLSKKTSAEFFIKIASMNDPAFQSEIVEEDFHKSLIEAIAISALEQIQIRAQHNSSLIGELDRIGERSTSIAVRRMARKMSAAVKRGKLIAADIQ